MAIAGIEKYWCDVGKAIELADPEKAARAYLNGGDYVQGYTILLKLANSKVDAIVNSPDKCDPKHIEAVFNEIVDLESALRKAKKEN